MMELAIPGTRRRAPQEYMAPSDEGIHEGVGVTLDDSQILFRIGGCRLHGVLDVKSMPRKYRGNLTPCKYSKLNYCFLNPGSMITFCKVYVEYGALWIL